MTIEGYAASVSLALVAYLAMRTMQDIKGISIKLNKLMAVLNNPVGRHAGKD